MRYAAIQSRIWQDPDFRALTIHAQHAYLLLLSQQKLSSCGVVTLMPQKWAGMASDMTQKALEKALDELEDTRFIVVDRDSHELLIRSFVRHDGIMKQPNMIRKACREARDVESVVLQHAIADELDRCVVESGKPETREVLGALVVETAAVLRGTPLPERAEPETVKPVVKKAVNKTASRGTRIVEGFRPAPTSVERIREKCAGITNEDIRTETMKFENFWVAKPGAGALKADWNRTWENWMLKFWQDQGSYPRQQRQVKPVNTVDAWMGTTSRQEPARSFDGVIIDEVSV